MRREREGRGKVGGGFKQRRGGCREREGGKVGKEKSKREEEWGGRWRIE